FALNAHGRPKYTTIGALQLDMTDYKNPAGNAVDIGILADANYTNAAQNLFVKQLRDAYLPFLTVNTTSVCGYGCSDHASGPQPACRPRCRSRDGSASTTFTSTDRK